MNARCLEPFPITQVNYPRNKYTHDVSSHADLRHINKTSHMGRLKPYDANNQHEVPQGPYNEPGPGRNNRYEVEKPIYFSFSRTWREPLYHMKWKEYLVRQHQWIHSDEIDEEVKLRFGKKENWNLRSKDEDSRKVVQDAEREATHLLRFQENKTVSCRIWGQPPLCPSKSL